jgi:AAA15 family ATPase/GTPase
MENQFKVVLRPTEKPSQLYKDSQGKLQFGVNIQRTSPDISQDLHIVDTTLPIKGWAIPINQNDGRIICYQGICSTSLDKLLIPSETFLKSYCENPEMEITEGCWFEANSDKWINSITISEFFNKTFTWNDLSQVNILTGLNGTGKTTVLDRVWSHKYFASTVKISGNLGKIDYLNTKRTISNGLEALDSIFNAAKSCDILLIDDTEKNLDLLTQRTLISQIVKINSNIQLFITTHSPSTYLENYIGNRFVIGELIS